MPRLPDRGVGLRRVRGRAGQLHSQKGSKVILSTAHLDHNPANNLEHNLAALCQKCHNTYGAAKRHSNRLRREKDAAGQLRLFDGPPP